MFLLFYPGVARPGVVGIVTTLPIMENFRFFPAKPKIFLRSVRKKFYSHYKNPGQPPMLAVSGHPWFYLDLEQDNVKLMMMMTYKSIDKKM